jgi:hypothetical protein
MGVFTGCGPNDVSQEHPDLGDSGQGLFTATLCDVLQSSPRVGFFELEPKVQARADQLRLAHRLDSQKPQLAAPLSMSTLEVLTLTPLKLSGTRGTAILLCGPTNAGKTIVGSLLRNQSEDFHHVEMSRYVKRRYSEYGGADPSQNLSIQDFVENEIWGNGDYGAIAQDVLRDPKPPGTLIITGARRPEEVEVFKSSGYSVVQVFLTANSKLRWDRHVNDTDDWHSVEREDFVRRNMREYEWGLAKIARMRESQIIFNEQTDGGVSAAQAVASLLG